jgi:hypothetical protein
MVENFPLYWPEGWKRTAEYARKFGRFRTGFAVGRDDLIKELERLGAQSVVLSTNIPLRRDGLPMATAAAPKDPGVAVYFTYKKQAMCFACDQFEFVKDNISAIKHTIAALRGIERWGASDMLERAFRGFTALPGTLPETWRKVMEFAPHERVSVEAVELRFRELAKRRHPDVAGGDHAQMQQLNEARDAARLEMGVA